MSNLAIVAIIFIALAFISVTLALIVTLRLNSKNKSGFVSKGISGVGSTSGYASAAAANAHENAKTKTSLSKTAPVQELNVSKKNQQVNSSSKQTPSSNNFDVSNVSLGVATGAVFMSGYDTSSSSGCSSDSSSSYSSSSDSSSSSSDSGSSGSCDF